MNHLLLSAAALAAAAAPSDEPAAGPASPLLRPVAAGEAERLRKACCRVSIQLAEGIEVKGTLSDYSGVEGVFRVATDPESPSYTEKLPAIEVKSIEILGGAEEHQSEAPEPRRGILAEIKTASDEGRLDALVADHEKRLTGLRIDGSRPYADRFRVGRTVRDETWLLFLAYYEQAGLAPGSVEQAKDRLRALEFEDPEVRNMVLRRLELLGRDGEQLRPRRRGPGSGTRPGG